MKCKDGTVTCTSLKYLKESNLIEVAEYITAHGIQEEPDFAWWVLFTLRKRGIIIAAVNSCVRKYSHKYGIEVPTSVKHAERIYNKNGNRF